MREELANEALLQSLFDGESTPEEQERAVALLKSDAKWRKLYLSYGQLHHGLCERFEDSNVVAMPMKARRRSGGTGWKLAAALALFGVSLTLLLGSLGQPQTKVVYGPESRGRLIHAEGGITGNWMEEGSRLELERGAVSLTFSTGVEALIEGPAVMEMTGENSLHLEEGRGFFRVPEGAEGFVCTTESLFVEDLGTEFGILAGATEEVHVITGQVRMKPHGSKEQLRTLDAGERLGWSDSALTLSIPERNFASSFQGRETILADDFDEPDGTLLHGKSPDVGAGSWEVTKGNPIIRNNKLDTSGAFRKAAFVYFDAQLSEANHVLLLTVEAETSEDTLHSLGWAGVSLFTGEEERIFIGDPDGPGVSWGLHPVGWQVQNAIPQAAGKRIVTLRYEYRTGLVELFEGDTTTGEALASEWIAPELNFNRLRIANGSHVDGALDAGARLEDLSREDDVNVRSDIAIRSLRLDVLTVEGE